MITQGKYKSLSKRHIYLTDTNNNLVIDYNDSTVSNDGDNTTLTLIAGEDISKGSAISITGVDTVMLASNVFSDGLPCDGIALTDASSGGNIVIAMQNGSEVSNDGYEFIAGQPVYLVSGTPNIGALPTANSGEYKHILGIANSESSFTLNLDNIAPYYRY